MTPKLHEEIIRTYKISDECIIISRYGQNRITVQDSNDIVDIYVDDIKEVIEALQDIQKWLEEHK